MEIILATHGLADGMYQTTERIDARASGATVPVILRGERSSKGVLRLRPGKLED